MARKPGTRSVSQKAHRVYDTMYRDALNQQSDVESMGVTGIWSFDRPYSRDNDTIYRATVDDVLHLCTRSEYSVEWKLIHHFLSNEEADKMLFAIEVVRQTCQNYIKKQNELYEI